MNGRRLKKRITIEQNNGTKTSKGDIADDWVGFATRWATVLPTNGREFYQIQQRIGEVSTIFKVRYDEKTQQITPKMRINYNGVIYDIKSPINEEEKDKYILIACTRIF